MPDVVNICLEQIAALQAETFAVIIAAIVASPRVADRCISDSTLILMISPSSASTMITQLVAVRVPGKNFKSWPMRLVLQ